MDDMVKKLREEEKRLTEKEQLIGTDFRHPPLDIAALLREGYISADDYRLSRK